MAAAVAGTAHAQNAPAPQGQVVLDLAGTMIHQTWTQYTTSFVAKAGTVNSSVTFAFRSDPGYFALDNVSVVQAVGTPINLIKNSGFELGSTGATPTNWSYNQTTEVFGQGFSGVADSTTFGSIAPYGGSYTFESGSTGGYDFLSQTFATTAGQTYDVSFYLNWSGMTDVSNYQQVSTNGTDSGGDGVDLLVYAPNAIPEPASLTLFGFGMAALGWARRRRA